MEAKDTSYFIFPPSWDPPHVTDGNEHCPHSSMFLGEEWRVKTIYLVPGHFGPSFLCHLTLPSDSRELGPGSEHTECQQPSSVVGGNFTLGNSDLWIFFPKTVFQ